MSVLALLLLLAGTAGLVFIEIKILKGKWYSPFCLLSVSYGIATIFVYIASVAYGFEAIKLRFSLIVLFYLAVTLAFEFLLKKLFEGRRIPVLDEPNKHDTGRWLDIASIAIPTICIIWFIILAVRVPTLGMIVQEEFQSQYASQMYWLRLMCIILGAYQASRCSSVKDKRILICLLLIVPNFLTFVKGVVIISFISDVLAFAVVNRLKLSWKPIVIVGVCGMSAFYCVYLVEYCIWDISRIIDPETHRIIFFKIVTYLSSGIEAFNMNIDQTFRYDEVVNVVLAPYQNFLAALRLTSYVDPVTPVHTVIGSIEGIGDVQVNTHSYFGALYLFCGLFFGMIMHFLNYLMAYFLYSRAELERHTWKVAYAIFSSGFVLSWFDYFYLHTYWGYILAMITVVALGASIYEYVKCCIKARRG